MIFTTLHINLSLYQISGFNLMLKRWSFWSTFPTDHIPADISLSHRGLCLGNNVRLSKHDVEVLHAIVLAAIGLRFFAVFDMKIVAPEE